MIFSQTNTTLADPRDKWCSICKKSGHIAQNHIDMPDIYGEIPEKKNE